MSWLACSQVPASKSHLVKKIRLGFLLLVIFGLTIRIAFVVAAGGHALTFHSGGSDAPTYNAIAQHLVNHEGYKSSSEPTAFYPPGYPFLIAGLMDLFGKYYLVALRFIQLIVGLLTVIFCAWITLSLTDKYFASATLIFGLFMPTLIFSTAQALSECVSAFLTTLFLLFLVREHEKADPNSAVALGLVTGVASLVRFNTAAFPLVALLSVFFTRKQPATLLRASFALLLPVLIICPWLIRNEIVFHGRALLSTQTGITAVMGILTPEGRTQPGDTERLKAALSNWKTNEADENREALGVAARLWRDEGLRIFPLLAKKTLTFWLGTDQLMDTGSLPAREAIIRSAAVVVYWGILVCGIVGWLYLRKTRPQIANIFLIYAAGLTVLHFPFTMNTRIRIPLMDPLIVILSGIGFINLIGNDLLLNCRNSEDQKHSAK